MNNFYDLIGNHTEVEEFLKSVKAVSIIEPTNMAELYEYVMTTIFRLYPAYIDYSDLIALSNVEYVAFTNFQMEYMRMFDKELSRNGTIQMLKDSYIPYRLCKTLKYLKDEIKYE